MLHDYDAMLDRIGRHADRQVVVDHFDSVLLEIWQQDYIATSRSPSNILVVTFGDENRRGQFCRHMFDHASGHPAARGASPEGLSQLTEDRVVAVWGTSRYEPSKTRDKGRIKGFLADAWSRFHPGYDRGHFFAHTMGGGLDINLFPQSAKINRGRDWREMETYCASNPGTFCFVRPIYMNNTWRPARLEYGIFKMETGLPVTFWGRVFEN